MVRNNSFGAIFIGNSGNYYSADTWNFGNVPPEEKAELTDLVYDRYTRVMYYQMYNGKKIACCTPYLSENGKYCRFVEDEIIEIG